MHRASINADVARVHHPTFAAVERELEHALDHDSIIDRQGAVKRRLDPGCKINQTDDGAVWDVNSGLFSITDLVSCPVAFLAHHNT